MLPLLVLVGAVSLLLLIPKEVLFFYDKKISFVAKFACRPFWWTFLCCHVAFGVFVGFFVVSFFAIVVIKL